MDLITLIEEHARRASQAGEQPSQRTSSTPAPTPAGENPLLEEGEPEWEEIEDVDVAAEASNDGSSPGEKPPSEKEDTIAEKGVAVRSTMGSDEGEAPVTAEKESPEVPGTDENRTPAAHTESTNANATREIEELRLKAEAMLRDADARTRAAEERMRAAEEKFELADRRLRELDGLEEGKGKGGIVSASLADLKMKEVDGKMREADEKMKQVDEKMRQADEKMRQVDEKMGAMWGG